MADALIQSNVQTLMRCYVIFYSCRHESEVFYISCGVYGDCPLLTYSNKCKENQSLASFCKSGEIFGFHRTYTNIHTQSYSKVCEWGPVSSRAWWAEELHSFLKKWKAYKWNWKPSVSSCCFLCRNTRAKLCFKLLVLKLASPKLNWIGSGSELISFHPPLCTQYISQEVHVPKKCTSIYLFSNHYIFSTHFILVRVKTCTGSILRALGVRWEYTQEMPVHTRATCMHTFTHSFTPWGDLKETGECRGKPLAYMERMYKSVTFIFFYILLSDISQDTIN